MEFTHAGTWTAEAVERIPDRGDHTRYELLAPGVLTITPAQGHISHQRAAGRLARVLDVAADAASRGGGPEIEVLSVVAVAIPGERLCVPDIVVVDQTDAPDNASRIDSAQVLAVAEITSAATELVDRRIKPDLYAAAGIGYYLLCDPDTPRGPVLELFTLDPSGDHVLSVRAVGGAVVEFAPFCCPFRLDPATLTGIRA